MPSMYELLQMIGNMGPAATSSDAQRLSLLQQQSAAQQAAQIANLQPSSLPSYAGYTPGISGASQAAANVPSASNTIVDALQKAGFSGNSLRTAYAVAMAESGLKPTAHNPNASTGDNSYGLFQINMLGGMGPERRRQYGLKSNEDLYDPYTNARVAYLMSNKGTNWGPWSAYNNGAYKKYLNLLPSTNTGQLTAALPGSYNWMYPLRQYTISQGFGNSWSGYKSGRHTGVDFAVPGGTKFYSSTGGTVEAVMPFAGDWGNTVLVRTPDGYQVRYGHLSNFASGLRAGMKVTPGMLLGYTGNTGKVRGRGGGYHLHFEVKDRNGRLIDPMTFLKRRK